MKRLVILLPTLFALFVAVPSSQAVVPLASETGSRQVAGASRGLQSADYVGSIIDFSFSDRLHGWAVGVDLRYHKGKGVILRTVDGGDRWRQVGPKSRVFAVSAPDAKHCWTLDWGAYGSTVWATKDGGATWQKQRALAGAVEWAGGIEFVDARHGWAVGYTDRRSGRATISATSDGGKTWRVQRPGTASTLAAVDFVDARRGWAVGDGGVILATRDGGSSWRPQRARTKATLTGVCFVSASRGWVSGAGGAILATSDGGVTWRRQTSGTFEDLIDVSFADASHGWAIFGWDADVSEGELLATSDGGVTWVNQQVDVSEPMIRTVLAVDAHHCWIGGDFGTVLVTTD